jgi:hypothetical protein
MAVIDAITLGILCLKMFLCLESAKSSSKENLLGGEKSREQRIIVLMGI